MSHYIVLVKQVPDVTQITDNAFDPETGNLMRGKLPSVINDLDNQAFAYAQRMRSLDPSAEKKLIALSMGPPMAEDVLRYCWSRGADQAVLLTDRALGGADTWATANPLAFAIRRIVRDIFNGSEDYFIVSGMQSVDGDTAQVPAQIAEELKIPCIAYATDIERNNDRFEFTRIISGGSQVVTTKTKPAVVTVAKYEFPVFPTFANTRRANKTALTIWSADDVKPTAVGVKGSKTRVIRVFPPPKTSRKCHKVENVSEFADLIKKSFNNGNGKSAANQNVEAKYLLPDKRQNTFDRRFEGTDKESQVLIDLAEQLRGMGIADVSQVDESLKAKLMASHGDKKIPAATLDNMLSAFQANKPSYHGEVWVVAEHDGESVTNATLELTGKARELADSLNTHVGVRIAGKKVAPFADTLIAAGADTVYVIEHELLEPFDPTAHRKAMADLIEKYWPQIVLFAATPQGRVLAPMISYRVGCGLTADGTGLDIRDSSRKGEIAVLMQTRPALGGNVMAPICTKDSRCQMATARPGVMKKMEPDASRKGQVVTHAVTLTEQDVSLNILKTEKGHGAVNFHAGVIVSGGRGIPGKAMFDTLVNDLCGAVQKSLPEASVERGASRAAVEQGYIDRIHQVGQTGTAVGPEIYIAMGISGAIQHMIGVANTRTIFAINNDPHAPILKQCDYYMVGNAEDIVPKLVQTLGAN